MALTTYSDLKSTIQSWADDDDVASFADDYIDIVEARFNRELRVREMEEEATLTLDSNGEASLPADFLEARTVYENSNPLRVLEFRTPENLIDLYPTATAGVGKSYTIEGSTFRARPIPSSSVILKYYEKIPALSDSQTTNWLLTKAPEVYLYGCEAEHAWKVYDNDRNARAGARMQEILDGLMRDDKSARWPNAAARVRGVTP